jgi:hypothetical protein
MAWPYTTLGTVAPGDVLRANSGTAAYNSVIGNVDALRVPPMAVATLTSPQSVPSQATPVVANISAATIDTDGMITTGASGLITIKTAGVYRVGFTVPIAGVNTTGVRYAGMIKNNTGSVGSGDGLPFVSVAPVNIAQHLGASAVMSLAVNDTLQLRFVQTSTASLNFSNFAGSQYYAVWLGQVS